MTDTAEYWNDIKASFNNIPKHKFTHAKGFDCGHFHVYESKNIDQIDCYACIEKMPSELKSEFILHTKNKENQRIEKIKNKWLEKYPNNPVCECGFVMLKRSGKNGEFFGCSQYPKCKCTKSINK